MKNKLSLLAFTCLILLLAACQKTITPPLNNSNPQLVIQGAVSDTTGPYHVTISKTVNFYATNNYPPVSGATVVITDITTNVTDSLTESSPGVYSTHTIIGTPGNTYQLKVLVEGKTYTASSTMPQPVVLDSVSYEYEEKDMTSTPQVNFQDPANTVNYYSITVKKNGKPLAIFQAENDELSNGRYIHTKVDGDSVIFRKNDVAQVFLASIDHGTYTFLSEAAAVAFNNNQLAAPATPSSNIAGGCVGYFSAQSVSNKSKVASR